MNWPPWMTAAALIAASPRTTSKARPRPLTVNIGSRRLACTSLLGVAEGTDGIDSDSPDLLPEEVGELEEAESEAEPISYSGTDFDAEGLVRRLQRGDIVIPNFGHSDDDTLELAPYQRGFVWRRSQMDRFIESLLLGYPIPGIMLVEQADKRYLVLDGQQRLKTLESFHRGIHANKVFSLVNVADGFKGLTYDTLSPEQRRTLDNTFIQATIVRSDGTPSSLESVYQIFERLNSGGTQLTPHEIRIALYSGELVRLLAALNEDVGWRSIYGAPSLRLRDQELILRILALYSRGREYSAPMKKFLNKFISDHRNLQNFPTSELTELFQSATNVLSKAGAREAIRRQGQRVNAALLEAVVVACMQRIADGLESSTDKISACLQRVISDPELVKATIAGTTYEENVRLRLANAKRAFSEP